MKPLKLVINAFGPYIDKTEIDFTKFGDNGLYLITGTTGAGKTTIFDALSFALFGQASGTVRSNPQSLRSDFAKDDNITYVELEFLNNDEKYFIRRECGYKKLNRNGHYTQVSENAELIKPTKETVSGKTEVNEEIKNILGIDKNQFAQIVMIAQGEFQKFLNSPTKERKEIFRKIFNTYFYDDFQSRLKEMLDSELQGKSTAELLLGKNIETIIPETDKMAELQEEKNLFRLDEILSELNKGIKNDTAELEKFDKLFAKKQEEITKLGQKIKEAQIAKDDRNRLDELRETLPELQETNLECEKAYKTEKNRDKKRKDLTIAIEKLNSDLKEYEEVDLKRGELEAAQKDLEASQNTLKELLKQSNNLDISHEKNKKNVNKLKDVDVKITKLDAKIEKNGERNEILEKVLEQIENYRNTKDNYNSQAEVVLEKQKEYEEKKGIAEELYRRFIENQAGLLAKKLKEGSKCPVCGSKKHPEPAKLSENAVTEKECDKANKEAEKAQKEFTAETKEATKIEADLKTMEKNLITFGKKEFNLKVIEGLEEKTENALSENSAEAEKLKIDSEELNKKLKEKNRLEKEINEFDKTKASLLNKINPEQEKQTTLKSSIASLDAIIKEKVSKLEYATYPEALSVLEEKEKELKELKKALEKADAALKESSQKLSQIQGQIKELEKKVTKQPVIDIQKLKNKLDECKTELEAQQKNTTQISHRNQTNKTVYRNLSDSKKVWEESSERISVLDNLYRTTSGNLLGGKQKISFENYVLATYFDEIIKAANLRFQEMTAYQFELVRTEEKSGGGQTGLDLDVFDAYTTKYRNVSTLSGGESFKAALALSLGLSDIVQQQAGGIRIETMFIDEGFGSLDPESLEQTMKILHELSGNKTLIGIISHVEALREKIEKKIVVTKTPSGSKLEINI